MVRSSRTVFKREVGFDQALLLLLLLLMMLLLFQSSSSLQPQLNTFVPPITSGADLPLPPRNMYVYRNQSASRRSCLEHKIVSREKVSTTE